MSILVDPDNCNAVINVHNKWLKTPQSKRPKMHILINAIAKKVSEKAGYNFCRWLPNLYIWHKIEEPDIQLTTKIFQAFDSSFYVIFWDTDFIRGDI